MKILLMASMLASLHAQQNVLSRVYLACEKDKSCTGIKLVRTISRPYTLSGSALVITKDDGAPDLVEGYRLADLGSAQ
jgi:hypothetical protein